MYHVLLKNSQFAISLFKVNEFLKLLIQAIEEAIVLGIYVHRVVEFQRTLFCFNLLLTSFQKTVLSVVIVKGLAKYWVFTL